MNMFQVVFDAPQSLHLEAKNNLLKALYEPSPVFDDIKSALLIYYNAIRQHVLFKSQYHVGFEKFIADILLGESNSEATTADKLSQLTEAEMRKLSDKHTLAPQTNFIEDSCEEIAHTVDITVFQENFNVLCMDQKYSENREELKAKYMAKLLCAFNKGGIYHDAFLSAYKVSGQLNDGFFGSNSSASEFNNKPVHLIVMDAYAVSAHDNAKIKALDSFLSEATSSTVFMYIERCNITLLNNELLKLQNLAPRPGFVAQLK